MFFLSEFLMHSYVFQWFENHPGKTTSCSLVFAPLSLQLNQKHPVAPSREPLLLPNPWCSRRLLLIIPDNFLVGFEDPLTVFVWFQPLCFISALELFQVTSCSCMFLIVFACVCLLCLLPLLCFACLALFYLIVFAWGPAGESFFELIMCFLNVCC